MSDDPSGRGSVRSRLASVLDDCESVDLDELRAYVDQRYSEMQDEIMEYDLDDYEGQLNIVSLKGQQEELVDLVKHFEGQQ